MHNNSPFFIDIGQGLSVGPGMPTISDWNTSGRPKKPQRGAFGFNSDTNSLEFWNGSSWLTAKLSKLVE